MANCHFTLAVAVLLRLRLRLRSGICLGQTFLYCKDIQQVQIFLFIYFEISTFMH